MKYGGDGAAVGSALRAALAFRRERAEAERTGRFWLLPAQLPEGLAHPECVTCGEPTRWLDQHTRQGLHPGACTDAVDVAWFTALAAQRHAQPFRQRGGWPYVQGTDGRHLLWPEDG